MSPSTYKVEGARMSGKDAKRKYISSSEKAEYILKKILNEGPLSVADLTEYFIREYNMRASTARSSASNIVNTLIDLDVLEYIGTDKRGSKRVDITPFGIQVLTFMFSFPGKTRILSANDVINALKRKNREDLIPLIKLFLTVENIKHKQRFEEELEEFEEEYTDILDFLEFGSELEDRLGTRISDWSDLEESLINTLSETIRELFLEKKGRLYDLIEFTKNLNEEERRALIKVLFVMRESIEEEIMKLEKIKKMLEEFLSKQTGYVKG